MEHYQRSATVYKDLPDVYVKVTYGSGLLLSTLAHLATMCSSTSCNGGLCTATQNGLVCTCSAGQFGDRCQVVSFFLRIAPLFPSPSCSVSRCMCQQAVSEQRAMRTARQSISMYVSLFTTHVPLSILMVDQVFPVTTKARTVRSINSATSTVITVTPSWSRTTSFPFHKHANARVANVYPSNV